ncbi:MAG TPA: hypothetical protein VMT67_11750 [Terriglobales bacterium]|nr:hypothetical protein [Terriglobales bacterium]
MGNLVIEKLKTYEFAAGAASRSQQGICIADHKAVPVVTLPDRYSGFGQATSEMRNVGCGKLSSSMPGEVESGVHSKNRDSRGGIGRSSTLVGASDGVWNFACGKSGTPVEGGPGIIGDLYGVSPNGEKGMKTTLGFQLQNYEITQLLNFPIS